MLKKILLASMFAITAITGVTYAEDDMKTVASKAYVDTKIETKQLKIPAAGQPNVGAGETVMTYTATGNGQIGERGLYSDISSYDASTDGDKLITASALNATFTNLPTTPTTKLECANSPACTLWTIVDQTAYAYKLPDGYTRLEYIESTGTQYIDTGLPAGSNTRILAQYKLSRLLFNSPISVRDVSSAGAGFGVGLNGSEQFISDYNGDRKVFTTITPNTTDIITVDKNKNVCTITIGGQSETVTNTVSTFTTTNTLPFFAQNSAGTVSAGRYTFYSFKMWNNNTLVRDFVPAKNASGVIGMYDTVSGQFFTNAGTGDFIAGPPVN